MGEGASSLFGGWFGSPENVCCSRATPWLHRCKSGALEQETFSGLPGHLPKRLLAPSPIDLGAVPEFGGCTRQSGSQFYITELVLNCFLGYVIACVVAQHIMCGLHYIIVFELFYRVCNLALHYRIGFE